MPELPDVEIFKRYLDATALHQEIVETRVHDERVLEDVSAAALQRRVTGRRLEGTARHGKHLFATLGDDVWLMLHFGMTGDLRYFRRQDHRPDHVRLALHFANGYRLVFVSRRRLGRVALADSPEAYVREAGLGPDALTDIDMSTFLRRLEGRRGGLKSALTNQRVLAGVGNVYADEVLFQAGLHPKAAVRDLAYHELARTCGALRRVLSAAIEAGAAPADMPRGFLLPRREQGAPCPRCGTPIRRIRVSGRSTYLCPECQG